ncbi:hypothetical protein [Deinococcus sedimenti]|uniref:Uncharacterized protein n=1 Tax=Deinococcus sedimenti TaxID=1867090 RepID=A0ABQ2S7F0_9DEIO|nr:hypothetical protein [Deinococcus sedimenti]GGS04025.1 hypothetical protein GCM10008960_33340 [Deinococcus sedimenti]
MNLEVRDWTDLPLPTQQVRRDQTDASGGDRARPREGWPARGAVEGS